MTAETRKRLREAVDRRRRELVKPPATLASIRHRERKRERKAEREAGAS